MSANDLFSTYEFSNGIRLVHQQLDSRITHCGFVVDAGSRDETADIMGMAHLIEHMFFKGTSKRKSIHILNRLEFIGGELNAYTTKDKTCLFACVPSEYFPRTADLLSDIMFQSTFPIKELEKEKNVIHEEIDMYLDYPEENILDIFQEKAFADNPLGYNILGTHSSLNHIQQADIQAFYRSQYTTKRLAFVYSGPKSQKQVARILERQFQSVQAAPSQERKHYSKSIYKPFQWEIETDHIQSYLALGGLAPNRHSEQRSATAMLMNILGGPGLNSKLNLAIREKHGYAYDIEGSYQALDDLGHYLVYVGTDKKHLKRTVQLIRKELKHMSQRPLSSLQLHRYKTQFKGQILMGEENRSSLILGAGKLLLENRSIDSLETIFKRIDQIGATDLMGLAEEMFDESKSSLLIFKGRGNT